jgi:hypothetical protein
MLSAEGRMRLQLLQNPNATKLMIGGGDRREVG